MLRSQAFIRCFSVQYLPFVVRQLLCKVHERAKLFIAAFMPCICMDCDDAFRHHSRKKLPQRSKCCAVLRSNMFV